MNLYIQIVDGAPFEHPILESNLLDAFPGINLDDPASGYAKFVRLEPPQLGTYEKNQTVNYELVDGVYTDVFRCEQFTAEEKLEKQNRIKEAFAEIGFNSWTFNEELCIFEPPFPPPNDNNHYGWDEEKQAWYLVVWDETTKKWVKQ
jgi:hypothetical protein